MAGCHDVFVGFGGRSMFLCVLAPNHTGVHMNFGGSTWENHSLDIVSPELEEATKWAIDELEAYIEQTRASFTPEEYDFLVREAAQRALYGRWNEETHVPDHQG